VSQPVITVFGLGEAGGLIGGDLATAGVMVRGYDPKPVATPQGVIRFDNPREAVKGSDIVIALTAAQDADAALEQAFDEIPETAQYADFSTGGSDLKQGLASRCAQRNIPFTDIALMAIVPGNGLKTPALASGSGAEKFCACFQQLGMPVESIGERAGDAAARKLLRSVMMKGLAAVVVEAMEAAHQAGCAEWLWDNMVNEISKADERLLPRLVQGTKTHALRRLHEMEASVAQIESLGAASTMTQSTVEVLRFVLENWRKEAAPRSGQGSASVGNSDIPEWFSVMRKD
jgi:3-hydroxyisobutyrate dehydrogenase-like beta-hydroxyacid dehydrogenase